MSKHIGNLEKVFFCSNVLRTVFIVSSFISILWWNVHEVWLQARYVKFYLNQKMRLASLDAWRELKTLLHSKEFTRILMSGAWLLERKSFPLSRWHFTSVCSVLSPRDFLQHSCAIHNVKRLYYENNFN